MDKPSRVYGHDAPILTVQDDLLNGLGVARAMHRVLSTAPREWSTRIGLYGPWGSGKTSILNLLGALERANGALVLSMSAWAATREGDVIAQFYKLLAETLRSERVELPPRQRAKATAAKFRRLGFLARLGRVGAEEFAPVPPVVTKVATEALSGLASAASSWVAIGRKDLEAIAALLQERRVVVFIDDLDRADPKVVPKTLLALRELLDWPGFSFVLAFDKRAISSALSEYSQAFGNDTQGFLEKVIDVPFEVPEAREEQRRCLADSAFRACCEMMPASVLAAVAPVLPREPRRLKLVARMLGALTPSLRRHSAMEVDWQGLTLYLLVKEASQAAADWVVAATTSAGVNWLLWVGDKEEAAKKEAEAKAILLNLVSRPEAPADADRVVDAAMRLLRHWDMVPDEVVQYWVGLAYCEPSLTLKEFQVVRERFAERQDPSTVEDAMAQAASIAGVSRQEAAADCLTLALASYETALDAMAEARTSIEWNSRLADACKSLLLLEHCWSQRPHEALAAVARQGPFTARLLRTIERWLTWTKNEGELALRQRERNLALLAANQCVDPELLFAETDPFWSSSRGLGPTESEVRKAWIETIRDALAPRIVSRLCERFVLTNGLDPVAAGDEKLSPWLVEAKQSPLYTKPEFTKQLVEILRAGCAEVAVRDALSKNAWLYLKQLLFQTRSGSWGGVDHAREIHARHPDIIPAAWEAVIAVSVPFRMRPSLRELRKELLGIGVAEALLPVPRWLVEEPGNGLRDATSA